MDTHIDILNWTKDEENACINIADRSEAFVWLYNETSKWYNKLNTIFNLIIVIGIYIFGSSGIPTLFDNNWVGSKYVNLAFQLIIILIGIIPLISKNLYLTEKITKCELASFRYSALFIEIKKELNKEKTIKINFNKFYDKISSEELELKHGIINIPNRIIKKYYKTLGSNAIKYENLFIENISNIDNKQTIFKLNKYM